MRRNAVRSIGVEACLFEQKELEQLYAVFKVTQDFSVDGSDLFLFVLNGITYWPLF